MAILGWYSCDASIQISVRHWHYFDDNWSITIKIIWYYSGDKVYDRCKHQVKHYPEVPEVLNKLKSLGYELAIASRTSATDDAESLLQLFNWNQYFTYKEIYPGMKTKHISSICKDSGAKYDQLLFFDDEHRNIRDLTAINVCSILVENGVNLNTIQHGIDTFLNQMRWNTYSIDCYLGTNLCLLKLKN